MGYPRFAAFIAHDEDKPITIYRRFERLAARNFLYLESRLAELQATMDQMDRENLTADNLAHGAGMNFRGLKIRRWQEKASAG